MIALTNSGLLGASLDQWRAAGMPDAGMAAAVMLAKCTVLLLVALVATRGMQRMSVVARHLVWFVSLAALLLVPVIATLTPLRLSILPSVSTTTDWSALTRDAPDRRSPVALNDTPVGTQRATGKTFDHTVPTTTLTVTPVEIRDVRDANGALLTRNIAGPPRSPVGTTAWFLSMDNWPKWITRWPLEIVVVVAVWGTVAVGLVSWLMIGALSVARIVRRARPLENAEWTALLCDISDRLSLERMPRLLCSTDITMPFASGLRTPTIVLPADSDGWSRDERTAVLLHELAHIKRRDIVAHTVSRLACAVYWFHPLVWTAARRLRAESEQACDDMALLSGAKASDYAEHLLGIVTRVRHRRTPSLALAMATRTEFEGRVLAILDPERRRRAPSRLQSASLVATSLALALVVGIAAPRESSAAPSIASNAVLTAAYSATAKTSANPSSSALRDEVGGRIDTIRRVNAAPDSTAAATAKRRSTSQIDSIANVWYTITTANTPPTSTTIITEERRAQDAVAPLDAAAKQFGAAMSKTVVEGVGTGVRVAASVLSKLNSDGMSRGARVPASLRPWSDDSSARAATLARILRDDSHADLRRIAAWGLEQRADDPAAVPALISALRGDAAAEVREMAAWALASGERDPRAIFALSNAVRTDRDLAVRVTAAWTLGSVASSGDSDVMAALSSALTTGNDDPLHSELRDMAAWAIGTLSPDVAPSALMTALRDKNPRVRSTIAWALFEIGDERAAPALIAALRQESDVSVQRDLVRAIGVLGDAGIPALSSILDTKDAPLRAIAVRALAGSNSGGDAWPHPRPIPRPQP